MTAEANIFWWPNINEDIEDKVEQSIACLASGENLKYQIPQHESGQLKTLTEGKHIIKNRTERTS